MRSAVPGQNLVTVKALTELAGKKLYVTCSNMDIPGRHLLKLNKPDTKRQIVRDFIDVWNLKKHNSHTQRAHGSYQGLAGGGHGAVSVKFQKCRMSDSGDRMYSTVTRINNTMGHVKIIF